MLKYLITAVLVLTLSGCAEKPSPAPVPDQVNEPPASDKNCVAESDWFPHQSTPFPDGNDFVATSNCSFHRWAWQMFLWLTQEVDDKPRFLTMHNPYDLAGIEDRDSLSPRITKSLRPRPLDEYLQAGTEGIMVDLQGKTVYYAQYVNDDFANFIEGKHPDNKINLTIPANVQAFPADKSFPINAIELKASWKLVSPGEDTKSFFTMSAKIKRLVNINGQIKVDPNGSSDNVTLALVGFHIAGVVKGHPEMIWATFEHKDNAPDVPADYNFKDPTKKVSGKDWTFYTHGTPYSECNVNPAKSPKLKLDEATQTLTPVTQTCRRYAFGNDANQKDFSVPTNIRVVKQLNASVAGMFEKDDVWSNYFEVGAIWFIKPDALVPGMSLATDTLNGEQFLIGSLKLSNSTIETFTQSQSTMNNCFRCHNTSQKFPPETDLMPLKPMNLNISHAFMNIYFWTQSK